MTTALPSRWDETLGVGLGDFYRDLHANPELSFHEHRTAQKVQDMIAPLGLEVTAGVGRTGVVAVCRNGTGPTVLLRADFDALPVAEKTGLPYTSTARGLDAQGADVPVMHACGHDMHATALVGALRLLHRGSEAFPGADNIVSRRIYGPQGRVAGHRTPIPMRAAQGCTPETVFAKSATQHGQIA